jgi:hypothetical protein
VGDVDSLHVEIDNLNDPLVGFYFIRSIDYTQEKTYNIKKKLVAKEEPNGDMEK